MKLRKQLLLSLVAALAVGGSASLVLAQSSTSSSSATSTSNEAVKQDATKLEQVTKSPEEMLKYFRETYPQQDLETFKLKFEGGRYVYEFESLDDDREYKLILNAGTQEELIKTEQSLDADERGGMERRKEALNLDKMKEFKEIKEIADKEVSAVQLYEWELDRDNGLTVWKLTYKDGKRESEVKVDAQSGRVLEVEHDND